MNTKKIVSLVLVSIMVLASNARTIYVNGTKITGTTTFSTGGGTVSYSNTDNVLTITGVNFSRSGSNNNGIDNQDAAGLEIIFKGTNNIEIANADVINCQARTTINIADGTTTLKCTANDHNAIKARGADVTITGPGNLKLISKDGAVIEGKNGTETCTMSIKDCTMEGGRNKFLNFNTVNINSFDTKAMCSTKIWMSKGEKYGYGPVKKVTNLLFGTNVHVSAPTNSTTEMLTYDANYGSTFTISDEHEDATATNIGDFQYKVSTIDGTTVAKIVGPTLAYYKQHSSTMFVPGYVTIGGLTLPVYVGENAFLYLDLCQWLSMEYGVRGIGDNAFAYGGSLMSVKLPSSIRTLGNNIFKECGVAYSNFFLRWSTLDLSATTIAGEAFNGIRSTNKNACFPTSSVAAAAKLITNLTKYIPEARFTNDYTSAYEFHFDSNYYVVNPLSINTMSLVGSDNAAIDIKPTTHTSGPFTFKLNEIAAYAFNDNTAITSLNIDNDDLTFIDVRAFAGTTALKTVKIKSKNLEIGSYGFEKCGATQVTLADVVEIFNHAFTECASLTTLELPAGLTFLFGSAFKNDANLKQITVKMKSPNSLHYGDNIFDGVNKNTCTLTVPAGTVNDYKSTLPWSQFYNIVADSAIKGDVNGDGVVTAADVTALYNYLLNGDSSQLVNGDQNEDNDITAADVTAVYNQITGN